MARKAFVTGGAGFLGKKLIACLLSDGFKVRALVRPGNNGQSPDRSMTLRAAGVELIWGDLLDREVLRDAVRGVTHVFHLAGRLYIPGLPDREYESLHVEGTRRVLSACAQASDIRAIVHCSSTGVLGPTGPEPICEDSPFQPSNIYESTKAAGEQAALEMGEQLGLHVVVARPGLAYGPGDLHLLGWFRAIQNGRYYVVGRGDNLFHPIFVDDVAEGLRLCSLIPEAGGRIYHLIGPRPVSIRQLAQAIAQALDSRLPAPTLPVPIALGVAALLESIPGVAPGRLPLTRSRVKFMTEDRVYCGERAHEELGFNPRVDLEAGLRRTVSWYRAEGLL